MRSPANKARHPGSGNTRSMLVLHGGALGDILLSLPIFLSLRDKCQHICLAGRPDIAEFFREIGLVDELRDIGSSLFISLRFLADMTTPSSFPLTPCHLQQKLFEQSFTTPFLSIPYHRKT